MRVFLGSSLNQYVSNNSNTGNMGSLNITLDHLVRRFEIEVVKKWPRPYLNIFNNQRSAVITKVIQKCDKDGRVCILIIMTKGNIFCMNKMDFHKHNNIYFIFSIPNRTFYQKCCDSDCGNFKSQEVFSFGGKVHVV